MKIPTHVKLPEGTPAWLEWLVGVTAEASKVRMAITMLVVLGASAFMMLWTAHNDAATLEKIAVACPFEAAGWKCSFPTNPQSMTATCVRNASGLSPMGDLAFYVNRSLDVNRSLP